mmetsp:Transcript_21698/g.40646  ORF Transcript_21698/g.40646 Transcript_21698/m.40646 type:complete len:196 (-) Transcript_21698:195-782(-)
MAVGGGPAGLFDDAAPAPAYMDFKMQSSTTYYQNGPSGPAPAGLGFESDMMMPPMGQGGGESNPKAATSNGPPPGLFDDGLDGTSTTFPSAPTLGSPPGLFDDEDGILETVPSSSSSPPPPPMMGGATAPPGLFDDDEATNEVVMAVGELDGRAAGAPGAGGAEESESPPTVGGEVEENDLDDANDDVLDADKVD